MLELTSVRDPSHSKIGAGPKGVADDSGVHERQQLLGTQRGRSGDEPVDAATDVLLEVDVRGVRDATELDRRPHRVAQNPQHLVGMFHGARPPRHQRCVEIGFDHLVQMPLVVCRRDEGALRSPKKCAAASNFPYWRSRDSIAVKKLRSSTRWSSSCAPPRRDSIHLRVGPIARSTGAASRRRSGEGDRPKVERPTGRHSAASPGRTRRRWRSPARIRPSGRPPIRPLRSTRGRCATRGKSRAPGRCACSASACPRRRSCHRVPPSRRSRVGCDEAHAGHRDRYSVGQRIDISLHGIRMVRSRPGDAAARKRSGYDPRSGHVVRPDAARRWRARPLTAPGAAARCRRPRCCGGRCPGSAAPRRRAPCRTIGGTRP